MCVYALDLPVKEAEIEHTREKARGSRRETEQAQFVSEGECVYLLCLYRQPCTTPSSRPFFIELLQYTLQRETGGIAWRWGGVGGGGMSSSRRDSSAMKKKGFCWDTVQLMVNSYLLLGLPTLFNRLFCWGWRKETLKKQIGLITELQVHTHTHTHAYEHGLVELTAERLQWALIHRSHSQ